MNTESHYFDLIQKNKDWESLDILWQNIIDKNTPEWHPGKALEYFVLRAFELNGADVRYPFQVKIFNESVEQIDGAIHYQHLSCLIECKDEKDRINIEPIAKLRNQLHRRPSGSIGCIFSINGYTEPALILSRFVAPQAILLWEKDSIEFALKNRNFCNSLKRKYQALVEEGEPNFNLEI
jgi:Restriction endonuclease